MRRIPRHLLTLGTAVSLALSIFAIGVWCLSLAGGGDAFLTVWRAGDLSVRVGGNTRSFAVFARRPIDLESLPDAQHEALRLGQAKYRMRQFLGFSCFDGDFVVGGVRADRTPGIKWADHLTGVGVPYAVLIPVLLLLPTSRAVRVVRNRRRMPAGRCTACGYDLRATPERCPECGSVMATGSSEQDQAIGPADRAQSVAAAGVAAGAGSSAAPASRYCQP